MIEVTGSPEVTSRGVASVNVVVRGGGWQRGGRRHVVVVLRYQEPITTYVSTQRLRGSLDVVVSLTSIMIMVSLVWQPIGWISYKQTHTHTRLTALSPGLPR